VRRAFISAPNSTDGRRKTLSLYAQDDIKVATKLTVNFELRWDFNGRYHERYGRWSNFNATLPNPVTGQPGALEFARNRSHSFERYPELPQLWSTHRCRLPAHAEDRGARLRP
jgi:hypothetical protein